MERNRSSRRKAQSSGDLGTYEAKRRFTKTPEPGPERKHSETGRSFVIQKHRASHLHYDFRLEADGVLKSWAVPKGPSLDPRDKRLAMAVEDHPLDYAGFEGVIPEGEYGGGTVMVWDRGTYTPDDATPDVARALAKGELKFTLHGEKLNGSWALVRTTDRQWLLLKHRDAEASDEPITETQARSVLSDRTLAQIAADEGGNVKKAATGDPPRASSTHSNEAIELPDAARKAAMPKSIQPMLATLADKPFSSDEWIFETKWDGVRTICYIDGGRYRLASRRLDDVSSKYPELSKVTGAIAAEQAVLDGEIVALDKNGIPRFQLLQPRFGLKLGAGAKREAGVTIAYYVFDLVYLNGHDLTKVPLVDRKRLLQEIIRKNPVIRYSDHVAGQGTRFFEQIEKMRLEGMIAKRANSGYVQNRSNDWLKVKTVERSEVVIGGYTQSRGGRQYFGALVVGLYEKDGLRYVGHTGGGFTDATLKQIFGIMQDLKTDHSPFASHVETNEVVQWIKPELVCEVKFSEWTDDGMMRQPVFLGMRKDKNPKDCVFEPKAPVTELTHPESPGRTSSPDQRTGPKNPLGRTTPVPASRLDSRDLQGDLLVKATGGTLKLTNLDKVYWPDDGYTKGDLLRYYHRMASHVLPYMKDRPLILKRYPDGINKPAFHQHSVQAPPDFVDTFVRDKDGEPVTYAIANNPASLLYVANLGAIALHPWSARRSTPENPDWILFDLDPGDAEFTQVLEVGLLVNEGLEKIGLQGYAKTSGSKGLHVYVPIRNSYTHDQVVQFATVFARLTAAAHGDLIAVERMVRKRKANRVYLDYLQNGYGKSLAGPYSVRARPHAMVSAPVEWGEVKKGKLTPEDFTIENMEKRIEKVGDLYKPVHTQHQSLSEAVAKLGQLARTRPKTED
jgi:bifunctional non-homologous end joining protein LigD